MANNLQDTTSPFITAYFVTPDGNKHYLSKTEQQVGARNTPIAPTMKYVTSLTVECGLGMVTKTTLAMNPTYEDGINIIDSPLIDFQASYLVVSFGYSTGNGSILQTPEYAGLITLPDVQFGSDIAITFTAQGAGGYKLARDCKLIQGSGTKRIDAIKLIFKDAKVEWNSSEIEEYITKNEYNIKPLMEAPINFISVRDARITVLHDLLRQGGCTWTLESGGKYKVIPLRKLAGGQPVTKLLFRKGMHSTGSDQNSYPIMSVSTDNKAIFISPVAQGFIVQGLNPLTGAKEAKKVAPADASGTGTGTVGLQSDQGTVSTETPDTRPEWQKAADEAMQANITLNPGATGTVLEVETIGAPLLNPGDMVTVDGVSKRLNGNYFIQTLKHSYSSAGFMTNLTLLQNVGNFLGVTSQAIPVGDPNTLVAPAQASGQVARTATPAR